MTAQSNRAERRRAAAEHQKNLRRFNREAGEGRGGAFSLWIIGAEAVIAGLAPRQAVEAIDKWFCRYVNASSPPVCLTCDSELGFVEPKWPEAFAIIAPANEAASVVIMAAICLACCARGADFVRGASLAQLQNGNPGMRVLDPGNIVAGAGRA
jgi:hypothetical protein